MLRGNPTRKIKFWQKKVTVNEKLQKHSLFWFQVFRKVHELLCDGKTYLLRKALHALTLPKPDKLKNTVRKDLF